MHYYQFNIGDYTSHTARLSPIEDLAYRRLLDGYYLNERPFNGCSTDVAREIGLTEYQTEVDYVLNKFFENVDGEWMQERAEREIKAYQIKLESASKAGKASAKARRRRASEQAFNDRLTKFNDCLTNVQPTNNQEPITNNKNNVPAKQEYENDDFVFAEKMYITIKKQQSTFKQPNLKSWAKTIRLMRQRDNRNYQDMEKVFIWARRDDFWQANILSAKKFREKYDQLFAQMARPPQNNGMTQTQQQRADITNAVLDIKNTGW